MTSREDTVDGVGCEMILTVIRDGIDDGSGEVGGTAEDITFLAQNAFGMAKETVEGYLSTLVLSKRVVKTGSRYQVAQTLNGEA